MATLGERLRDLILEKGLTQNEFAEIIVIKPATIHGYVTNSREPDNETQLKFAEYFDVSLDYLTGRANVRWSAPTKDVRNKSKNRPDDWDGFFKSPENKKYLDLARALAKKGCNRDDFKLLLSLVKPDKVKGYAMLIGKIKQNGIDPRKIIGFSLKTDVKL